MSKMEREQKRLQEMEALRDQEHSREKSLAMTKLEEAVMWANAGIARN